MLLGSDTGALEALQIAVLAGDLVQAVVAAGCRARPRSVDWDAELDARTACPVHRARLTTDERFDRDGLSSRCPPSSPGRTGRFAGPVLVLHGAADRLTSVDEAARWRPRCRRAQLAVVEGGRHDVLNDLAHRSVAAEIVQFLERVRLSEQAPLIVGGRRDRDTPDPDAFRGLFRRHAAGVAVITTASDRPVGFTATSLVALALDPPLLSFNLSRTSSSWSAVERGRVRRRPPARRAPGRRRRDVRPQRRRPVRGPTSWDLGPYGVPMLDDVLAWMVCRVETRVDAGDHAVVIGRVLEADYHPAHRPLIYHDGGFTRLPG